MHGKTKKNSSMPPAKKFQITGKKGFCFESCLSLLLHKNVQPVYTSLAGKFTPGTEQNTYTDGQQEIDPLEALLDLYVIMDMTITRIFPHYRISELAPRFSRLRES
jgi:hypothetical protein